EHHHMHVDVAAVVPAGKDAAEGDDAAGIGDGGAATEARVVVQIVLAGTETVHHVRLLLAGLTETAVVALGVAMPHIHLEVLQRRRATAGGAGAQQSRARLHLGTGLGLRVLLAAYVLAEQPPGIVTLVVVAEERPLAGAIGGPGRAARHAIPRRHHQRT